MDDKTAEEHDPLPVPSEDLVKAAHAVLNRDVSHLQLIPSVAFKLLELTSDQDTSIKDLSRVIETEPALAAKVLRIVNSAAFFLPKRTTSIKHAVNILGFSAVRQAALDQLFYNRLIRRKSNQKFNQLFFWQHCMFVASLGKAIAVVLKHPNPDMVYTGGLLHDIGKVILETAGRLSYSDYLTAFERSDCSLLESEKTFFGLTHADVGMVFSVEWNLPPAITAMIGFHHEPPPPDSAYAEFITETAIISFANYVAWVQGVGSGEQTCGPELQETVLAALDIGSLDLERLLEHVDCEMANMRQFYGIEFPPLSKLRATLVQTTIKLRVTEGRTPHGEVVSRENGEPARLVSILTMPHRSLDPDEFLPWTLEAIQEEAGFDRVMMLDIDPKRRGLVASHSWPKAVEQLGVPSFEIPMSLVSGKLLQCLREKTPVLIQRSDPADEQMLARIGMDELMAWPVMRHNRLGGIVCADNSLTKRGLDKGALTRMMPIVNELGVALVNAVQYKLARKESQIDSLTRLYNRGVINEFLCRLFEGDERSLANTVVGFLDVDHFKRFNDVCGHRAGDDVLKIVADILRNLTRPGDFIGRYGGEEFLLVLRNTGRTGALVCAERIRGEIERRGSTLSERFHNQRLTVSIGLAMYSPAYATYLDLVEAADGAMYRAKNEGRNRVVML